MGWEARPWSISGFGGWGENISEQYRGRHGTVTAGKRRAGQLAEGHGEGSPKLAKEKGCTEVPKVWVAPPLSLISLSTQRPQNKA